VTVALQEFAWNDSEVRRRGCPETGKLPKTATPDGVPIKTRPHRRPTHLPCQDLDVGDATVVVRSAIRDYSLSGLEQFVLIRQNG
jgi:hypothetical protein